MNQKSHAAESEAQVLDKKLAEAEEELQAFERSAEANRQVEAKRKELAEIEKKIARARAAVSASGPDNSQPASPSPSQTQSSKRTRASTRRAQPKISNTSQGQGTRALGYETSDDNDGTTSESAKSEKHGEWSELRAKQILGAHIDHPLVQTTLNYCESFLTRTMIKELNQACDRMTSTPWTLTELRKIWGSEATDYFQECAAWKIERNPRRTLSWNRYYYNGYLISKHGGPSGPYLMDVEAYKAKFQLPLFDYGDLDPDTANGDIEPANLTNLYKAFLRTEYSHSNPCYAHEIGLLGSQDKCKECGVTGSVSDLD
ncbi:hypothetical protein DIS24_g1672 [Lasiodiplodia hormozganensis]|uniref:Uncharacterized protein n=1 Tax=Lasiodiplodia hormozganensis TaxID=869390 RepID=A0AA39Z244_9PEZI|nr:hypothetical protein DIS24_g1672 [Lasiodiplodia hormozganensis]